MPILQPNPYDTLVEALERLRKEGYTRDFNQLEECLECQELNCTYQPETFTITRTYRFEGMSSAGDNSVLYAIETDDGEKGVLVDAYGADAAALSPEMLSKFRVDYTKNDPKDLN